MERFQQLAQMTNGAKGALVAKLPLEARFNRDRFNEGVVAEWYQPAFDDRDWGTKDTFHTWDAQDQPEDSKGHDYDGYGWYRVTIDVPAAAVNKPLETAPGRSDQRGLGMDQRSIRRTPAVETLV